MPPDPSIGRAPGYATLVTDVAPPTSPFLLRDVDHQRCEKQMLFGFGFIQEYDAKRRSALGPRDRQGQSSLMREQDVRAA